MPETAPPPQVDLESKSTDELAAMLREMTNPPPPDTSKPQAVEIPPAPSAGGPEEGKAVEEQAPGSPEATKTEPELPTEADIMAERLALSEALAKKFESLAGRHSGELGFLKQRLKELETRQNAPPREAHEEDLYPPEPLPAQDRPAVAEPVRDSLSEWAVGRAIEDEVQRFWGGRAEDAKLRDDIAASLKARQEDLAPLLETRDPVHASRLTRAVLDEALSDALIARAKARIGEMTEKRADQVRNLEQAKKKAAVSGSGAASPPSQARDLNDLSIPELQNLLGSMTKR